MELSMPRPRSFVIIAGLAVMAAISSASETDPVADNESEGPVADPPGIVATYQPPDFEVTVVPPLPAEEGTWSEIYASLAPAADAGSLEANYRLFRVAYDCYRAPRTEKQLQESKERIRKPFLSAATGTVESNPDAERMIADLERTYERCKDAPDDELARYQQWLTTAVEGGYLRALLDYSGTSFIGDERLDIQDESDADEIQRRAETSFYLLKKAERMGSIDAIAQLAFRYGEPHGPDHQRDPIKAFAYWYAYAWYEMQHENKRGNLSEIDQFGMKLSPREFQLAVKEGRRILEAENCCLKIPGAATYSDSR